MTIKVKVPSHLLLLFIIMYFTVGCGMGGNPEDGRQDQKEMPRAIMEMESGLQEIMLQADLIPLIEQYAAAGLTFEETILGEVLAREMEQKLNELQQQDMPQSEEEAWDNIKMTVTELYGHWNDLEPQLMQESVSREEMNSFEQNLDSLTVRSTAQNRFEVMGTANQLTGCLSQFMAPFAEPPSPLAHELKFHLRELVLKAAAGDYGGAAANMGFIKEQGPVLSDALGEGDAAELDTAISNLQRAVEKENLDLIRVNAAVLMENLAAAIRQLP